MIPTRSAACCTSSSECDERNTVRPSAGGLAHEAHGTPPEAAGRARSSARRGSSSGGPVHERLDEPELLAVALRELTDRAVEHRAEPLAELVAERRLAAAQAGERVELRAAGEAVEQPEIAGQVPDLRRGPRPRRRCASSPSSAARPEVGRIRSSRRRIVVLLPAPFGPRKPNTSPRSTRRSRSEECTNRVAVRLGEPRRLDRGRLGHPLWSGGAFAAVVVLKPDDVVEMRRRDLEDRRVLDRGDPVHGVPGGNGTRRRGRSSPRPSARRPRRARSSRGRTGSATTRPSARGTAARASGRPSRTAPCRNRRR